MKLLAKLRFYLHPANKSPSTMSSNGTQEIPKEKRVDRVPASLSTTRRQTAEVAFSSVYVASLFLLTNYRVIKHLDGFPCLFEDMFIASNYNVSISADYSHMCAMKGVMWNTLASLLVFSASAILVNILISLKRVQTTPYMLVFWVTFTFLWAIANVVATLIFYLNLDDDTVNTMFALRSVILMILGSWTARTVSHYNVQIDEQEKEIRTRNNEMENNRCMGLQEYEKCMDDFNMFSQVPLHHKIDIHM